MANQPPDPTTRPASALDVPVSPVGSPGGRRRLGPIVGVLALVVVVVGGIALAQAFPAAPVAPVVQPPPVAEATASPGPTPSPSLSLPIRLDAADLVARVLDGTIDEWLVYADATLRSGCQPPGARGCTTGGLSIDGLGLDIVPNPNPNAPADAVVPAGGLL